MCHRRRLSIAKCAQVCYKCKCWTCKPVSCSYAGCLSYILTQALHSAKKERKENMTPFRYDIKRSLVSDFPGAQCHVLSGLSDLRFAQPLSCIHQIFVLLLQAKVHTKLYAGACQ